MGVLSHSENSTTFAATEACEEQAQLLQNREDTTVQHEPHEDVPERVRAARQGSGPAAAHCCAGRQEGPGMEVLRIG